MTTNFTSLPIVDLAPLSAPEPSAEGLDAVTRQLVDVFETVGFAYLVNCPLSFTHEDVFGIAREFFDLPLEEKMRLAKRTFEPSNPNTYRGYFPVEPESDNLKEGFEMGPGEGLPPSCVQYNTPFVLTEGNVFPAAGWSGPRARAEALYGELQGLATSLMRLLAAAAGRPERAVDELLESSISTLRLLHYPAAPPPKQQQQQQQQELSCTPHTDSGLLTLLHQDATGGLEVLNAAGEWIAAPYVPGSVVANIGDLMAQASGGRFVATRHRVRAGGRARYSAPFFFEPGVDAWVTAAAAGEEGEGEAGGYCGSGGSSSGRRQRRVRYGEFVLGKMSTWVEFQDPEDEGRSEVSAGSMIDVGA